MLYSLPALFFYTYAWTTPDSIRWLLSKRKVDETKKTLRSMEKWNGVEIPDELVEKLILNYEDKSENDDHNETNVIDLFRTFNLRIKTIVLAFTWMVCSSLYYVLLLDQSELSSDPYLGFVMTSLVQLPGNHNIKHKIIAKAPFSETLVLCT